MAVGSGRTYRKSPINQEPEAIEFARIKAGLSKKAAADRSGLQISLYCEIEKGTRNATPANLVKIAAALNCPIVFLERKRDWSERAS